MQSSYLLPTKTLLNFHRLVGSFHERPQFQLGAPPHLSHHSRFLAPHLLLLPSGAGEVLHDSLLNPKLCLQLREREGRRNGGGGSLFIKLSPITKLENTVYFLPELLTTSVATLFRG